MIEIKKAGTADIEIIRKLTFIIWPHTYTDMIGEAQVNYMLTQMYSPTSLKNQMDILKHQFIIVYENKEALGFASYSPKSRDQSSIYRLHKLYVLPNQQRKRLGKLLIDYIIADILPTHPSELELNVNRGNPATAFYKKLGFEIKREEDIDIGGGFFMNDYVLYLPLPLTK